MPSPSPSLNNISGSFKMTTVVPELIQDRKASPGSGGCPSSSGTSLGLVKKVSFNRRARVKPVKHLNNYTDDELKACWYTKPEYEHIREQNAKTFCLFSSTSEEKDVDEEHFCGRGLVEVNAERIKGQHESIQAVLEQQHQHRSRIDSSDEPLSYSQSSLLLAKTYAAKTRSASMKARLRALLDRHEATT